MLFKKFILACVILILIVTLLVSVAFSLYIINAQSIVVSKMYTYKIVYTPEEFEPVYSYDFYFIIDCKKGVKKIKVSLEDYCKYNVGDKYYYQFWNQ